MSERIIEEPSSVNIQVDCDVKKFIQKSEMKEEEGIELEVFNYDMKPDVYQNDNNSSVDSVDVYQNDNNSSVDSVEFADVNSIEMEDDPPPAKIAKMRLSSEFCQNKYNSKKAFDFRVQLKNRSVDHLSAHSRTDHYICSTCQNKYTSRSVLNRHIRLKHPESIGQPSTCMDHYICSTCQNKYSSKTALILHVRLKHPEKIGQLSIRTPTGTHTDHYICSTCQNEYNSKTALNLHIRLKHPESIGHPSNFTCTNHYTCSMCQNKYASKSILNRHVRLKHPESVRRPSTCTLADKYTCSMCQNKYAAKNVLNRHIRLKHPESVDQLTTCTRAVNYTCSMCQNKYGSKKALNHHVRLKHPESVDQLTTCTRAVNYTCSLCQNKYAANKALNRHIRLKHPESVNQLYTLNCTGYYICSVCQNKYTSKSVLNRHIRLKHPESVNQTSACTQAVHYTCSMCQNKYGGNKALNRHVRLKHPESLSQLSIRIRTRTGDHNCSICENRYSSKRALNLHVRLKHPEHAAEIVGHESHVSRHQRRMLCAFEKCNVYLSSYKNYYLHLLSIHHLEIKEEKIVFSNRSEFVQWKENYELQHTVSFVRLTGKRRSTCGFYMEYYSCHRSYSPTITSGKRTKYVGSRKTGLCCPCRMKVIVKQNETVAYFTDTHLGHTCDPAKMSLNPAEKRILAKKLSDGLSFERILKDIEHSATDCSTKSQMSKRLQLTNREDLRSICKEFNISVSGTKHQNDSQNDHENDLQNDLFSIKIWIEEMRALGNDNPVLYVKFQHEEDPVFEEEDFVLVLMTQFQQEMYLQYGNSIICINGTHGHNSYDYYLYSLVTIDEFGNSIPIAFCLSNLKSNLVYETFFNSIKAQVGTVSPYVFMSDLEVSFYSAWETVMGAVKNKLPCLWHVFKDWTENLNKIANLQKREFIKKVLRNLCYELDPEKFEVCLEIFLEELENDEETHSFYIYFRNEWYTKQKQWAMCYRKCLGLSTNMVLESLHKQIKYFYLSGLTCKRLDKSIHALMRLAKRDVFKCLIELHRGKHAGKMKCINKAHKSSVSIKDENVLLITNNLWSVLSESKRDILYEVTKINETCPESLCGLKCTICNICIHMYLCTCLNSTARLNICKHIHAVCRVTNNPLNQHIKENVNSPPAEDEKNFYVSEMNQDFEENVDSSPAEDEINFYVSEIMEDNVVYLPQTVPTNKVEDVKPQLLRKLHKVIDVLHQIQVLPSQNEDTRQLTEMVDNILTEVRHLSVNSSNST